MIVCPSVSMYRAQVKSGGKYDVPECSPPLAMMRGLVQLIET
jgi:hypothetical protein